MCAPTVDTSKADATAEKLAGLTSDQWDWVKQQYEAAAPERAAASARANEISDAQLAAMRSATAQSDEYAGYNRRVFRPLEEQIVSDARGYDTEARREEAAGRAQADVEQAAGAAAAASHRDLTRMGVNPADGQYADMESQRELGTALGVAGSRNRARTQVETIGAARMADAASLGRGLPSSQATQASLALTAGNNAVSNAQVPTNITQAGVNGVNAGFNGVVGGYSGAGNIYSSSARTQAGAGNDGFASLAGSAMTAYAI